MQKLSRLLARHGTPMVQNTWGRTGCIWVVWPSYTVPNLEDPRRQSPSNQCYSFLPAAQNPVHHHRDQTPAAQQRRCRLLNDLINSSIKAVDVPGTTIKLMNNAPTDPEAVPDPEAPEAVPDPNNPEASEDSTEDNEATEATAAEAPADPKLPRKSSLSVLQRVKLPRLRRPRDSSTSYYP